MMGGYDCELFGKDDKIPNKPKEFWKVVKEKMMKGYGGEGFLSIWHSEEKTFSIFYDEETEAIWGQLDW